PACRFIDVIRPPPDAGSADSESTFASKHRLSRIAALVPFLRFRVRPWRLSHLPQAQPAERPKSLWGRPNYKRPTANIRRLCSDSSVIASQMDGVFRSDR